MAALRHYTTALGDFVDDLQLLGRRPLERKAFRRPAPPVAYALIQLQRPRSAVPPLESKFTEMGCNPGLEREQSLPAQPAASLLERLREERFSIDIVLPLIADRPPVTTGAKVAPQVPGEQPKAGP